MPETITIRAQEPSDADTLNDLWGSGANIADTLQLPYRSLAWRRDRLSQTDGNTHAIVAELHGQVVGSAALSGPANPRRRHVGQIGMAVREEFHNQGVGTALMEALIDLADNWLNLSRLELEVFTHNAPAIHLYRKFGFEVEGTGKRYAFRNGEFVDAHFMARIRREADGR